MSGMVELIWKKGDTNLQIGRSTSILIPRPKNGDIMHKITFLLTGGSLMHLAESDTVTGDCCARGV